MRLILIISLLFLHAFAPRALAITVPTFPSCASPQGGVKVSYSSGTHGIVGRSGTYIGSDTVYTLSDTAVTQCFCAESGEGIQTDWWKVNDLSESDRKVLESQNWIYVPAGELWGLAQGPYMARNTTLSCLPGSSVASSGEVLGTGIGGAEEGDVLGLAATGDKLLIYGIFVSGISFLAIGMRRLRNR